MGDVAARSRAIIVGDVADCVSLPPLIMALGGIVMGDESRGQGMWGTDIDCGIVGVVFCRPEAIAVVDWDDGTDMSRPVVLVEEDMSMSVLLDGKYGMPTPGVVDRRVEYTTLMLEELD